MLQATSLLHLLTGVCRRKTADGSPHLCINGINHHRPNQFGRTRGPCAPPDTSRPFMRSAPRFRPRFGPIVLRWLRYRRLIGGIFLLLMLYWLMPSLSFQLGDCTPVQLPRFPYDLVRFGHTTSPFAYSPHSHLRSNCGTTEAH